MNRKLFPIEITEPKFSGFLLVEGINDAIFFSVMLNYLDLGSSVQVAQMGGIDKLDQSLEALIKLDEFFQLKNLGVIRDADDDSSKAFQKVRNSLKRFNLPAPDQAYEYVRVAVAIVPDANSEGNLETLCLRTLDKSKLACIEKYIDCITRNNTPVKGERSFTRKIVFLSYGWCRKKVVITQDINLDFEWVSLQMLVYGNGIHRILSGLKNFYSNYQARAISFINVAQ